MTALHDKLPQLIAVLEKDSDDLWNLQNAALQLTVEGSDATLIAAVRSTMTKLAGAVTGIGIPGLEAAMAEAEQVLAGDDVSQNGADQVFSLVEALGAIARGEGPNQLLPLIGQDPPAADEAEPVKAAQVEDEAPETVTVLADSYVELDPEEIEDFCAESLEHIQAVELNLVHFEQTSDMECVAEIFRNVHSIKGGAQYLGLEATSMISHRMETLLDRIRSGALKPIPEIMAVLLRGVDHLAALLKGARVQKAPKLQAQKMVDSLDACLAGQSQARVAEVPAETAEVTEQQAMIPPAASETAEDDVLELSELVNMVGNGDPPEAPAEAETAATDDSGSSHRDTDADVELFASDYEEHSASARALLVDMEALNRDNEKKAVLTRNLHTVRGIAGFIGLPEMEALADGLETLMTLLFRRGAEIPHDTRIQVSQALDLLDAVFHEFVAKGSVTIEIDTQLQAVKSLIEREDRMDGWSQPEDSSVAGEMSLAAMVAAGDHPLAGHFAKLRASALSGNDEQVQEALDALEEGATLHGDEELATACLALAAAADDFKGDHLLRKLDELATHVSRELDSVMTTAGLESPDEPFEQMLKRVPGIGPRKVERILEAGIDSKENVREIGVEGLLSVRGINVDQARMIADECTEAVQPRTASAGEELYDALADLILDDDYDRELIQIYLTTTQERTAALRGKVESDDLEDAWVIIGDLCSAARYMGYEPLALSFDSVQGCLDAADWDGQTVLSKLDDVDRALRPLRQRVVELVGGTDDTASMAEEAELEEIFAESASSHLQSVANDIAAFLSVMNPELLSSIQHHASCVESAAANVGRQESANLAASLREAVEREWLDGNAVNAEAGLALVNQVRDLFVTCGLQPPTIEIPEPEPAPIPAPAPELSSSPESDPTEVDDLDAMQAASLPGETVQVAVPPPVTNEAAQVGPPVTASVPETLEVTPPAEPVVQAPAAAQPVVAASEPMPEEASPLSAGGGGGGQSGGGGDGSEPPDLDPEFTPGGRSLVEPQTTLRVDTEKIDSLMNMAAELVVHRSSLMVLGSTIREVVTRVIEAGDVSRSDTSDLRLVVNRFDEAATDLGRVSNQLQEGVMRIRMVPVKVLFGRVPRLVRDLAVREQKRVHVTFEGEDTELDKTVIEQLSDPAVHLIRNSISHGIETPADRLLAGKPAEGHLTISARHEGNMVTLQVEDDGGGIDLESVRRKLVDSGAATGAEAARMAERELLSALFLPGFSTSAEVNDVSGRGVGLDVVKSNIESLNGQVEVQSEIGKYTRFVMRIPLTMAIMQAQLVRVAEEVYSIPVTAVVQTVKITPDQVSTVENQQVITVREKVVPLVHLDEVFSYVYHIETDQLAKKARSNGNGSGHSTAEDFFYVVVLQGEGTDIGIVVDSVVGGQDIVIKSLEDELVDARGIAGAAILGDGTVTLILDVQEIQKMAIDPDHYEKKRYTETMRNFERYLAGQHGSDFGQLPS